MTPSGDKLHRALTQAIAEGRAAQVTIARKILGVPMSDKMPNLGGIAGAIDKLTSAIEDDAQAILKKVGAVHEKRVRVFGKADKQLASRDASLDAADAALDKLDAALGDNGSPEKLPT